MARYEHSIDVNVPLEIAYNQWTQFEEFPKFMEGVKRVEQNGETHLHWTVEIAGQERQWEAEISEQKPDSRIAWHSTTGAKNAGMVTFHYIDRDKTRVTLQIDYDPEGFIENVAVALGIVQRRISGDLDRFKDFIEAKGFETGAWRGEVERFEKTEPVIGGGSPYSNSHDLQEMRIPVAPTFYDAVANGSQEPSSYPSFQPTPTESRDMMQPDTDKPSEIEQDPGYGKSEERGQRSVLGDDTFISSGEGDGTNNGGGGIGSTGRSGMQAVDSGEPRDDNREPSGTAPHLSGQDVSHGANPDDDPMLSAGAVETAPPSEDSDGNSDRSSPA